MRKITCQFRVNVRKYNSKITKEIIVTLPPYLYVEEKWEQVVLPLLVVSGFADSVYLVRMY